MDNSEVIGAGEPVRRTRSGRAVRPPPVATTTPKASGRKKRKVVMMEVEVSDEEETNNTHVEVLEQTVETPSEISTIELENSDNAVEASEQFIKTNDHPDFDNCSNTAQFPEKSNSITEHEINSFKGAINTHENSSDNFMEVVVENEFLPGELPDRITSEDTNDSHPFKQINADSKSLCDEALVDELLTCGDSLVEADSITDDLLGGDSIVDPIDEDFLLAEDSLVAGDSLSKVSHQGTDLVPEVDSLISEDIKMDTETIESVPEVEHLIQSEKIIQQVESEDATNTVASELSNETEVAPSNKIEVPLSSATEVPPSNKTEVPTSNKTDVPPSNKTEVPLSNVTEIPPNATEVPLSSDVVEIAKSDPVVKTNENGEPETEVISEDELPGIQVAKVPETEEVSDDELPGPKRAELPADTEVVSEDELPTVKKEGTKRKLEAGDYDPGSPTSENENPTKKPTLEIEPESEKEDKTKPKKLPELDKYWKAVNDDPSDFTGWTYLLQYVDQENDMEAAREAYDAFLSHYPYCYGYWRKYADYEKRKGNKKKCEEVFERGLKAIPLSVDLWIHYLAYVRTSRSEEEDFIRSQFERAITCCGLEFRSDRLWDSYMKWETEAKHLQHVTALYDRLLATPTQGYTTHFDNFQEHIASHPPNKVLEVDEFLALRKEVKGILKQDAKEVTESEDPDVPPGEDEDKEAVSSDEEVKVIRDRIVSIRRKIHKNTVNAVTARWNYEEGIKRPYFHVKPLERCQLKNWQDYLDYEIEQGDKTRIIVLFERCLIACALYDEFWLRYVLYLEALKDEELLTKIKETYERACTIHHLKKPNLHTQWAMFEESIQNFDRAAEILVNLEKSVPNLLQVAFRRINLERRRGDHEKCCQLYEHYIGNIKNKIVSSNLCIKYARFSHKIMKNVEKAIEIINTAISKDPNNARLYLQLIDFLLQKEDTTETEILSYLDAFLVKDGVENEQKLIFAQRKLEYLEDFGRTVQGIHKAQEDYQKYLKLVKENVPKKKDVAKAENTSSKKEKNPPLPSSQSNAYGNYTNSTNSSNYNQYPPAQQGQYNYSQYGQGGAGDQYNYQNWQYGQGGYGGYNQWSGYGGGYSY